MKKIRIAVLVSGGGTNLQALLDAQQQGILRSGEIVLVVSDRPEAYALERAKKAGVAALEILKREFSPENRQAEFEKRLEAALQ